MEPEDHPGDEADEPVVRVEFTDELDLHSFHPRDVADIVREYLHHAAGRGWEQVRIIHGKGIGAMRQTVHRVLQGHPAVAGFVPGGEGGGSWGATRVRMRPLEIVLRPLGPADSYEELTVMLHAAYAPLMQQGMRFVASWQDAAETRRRCEGGDTLVAEAAGRIVGTITLYDAGRTDGSPWYDRPDVACIGQWAVDPAWQGRGVGRRLLDAAERRAAQTGALHLALDTSEHATGLIATYERRGFVFVEHVQWRSTNYRSVVMTKALPGHGRA